MHMARLHDRREAPPLIGSQAPKKEGSGKRVSCGTSWAVASQPGPGRAGWAMGKGLRARPPYGVGRRVGALGALGGS